MSYTFNTNLLSAQKTGSPQLVGTSLSGVAVSFLSGSNVVFATQQAIVVSLSTNDAGLAFNSTTVSVASENLSTFNLSSYPLTTVTVEGSVFLLPPSLSGSNIGVVKTTLPLVSVFTWTSPSTTVIETSALDSTRDAGTPNLRRLWTLGYI